MSDIRGKYADVQFSSDDHMRENALEIWREDAKLYRNCKSCAEQTGFDSVIHLPSEHIPQAATG